LGPAKRTAAREAVARGWKTAARCCFGRPRRRTHEPLCPDLSARPVAPIRRAADKLIEEHCGGYPVADPAAAGALAAADGDVEVGTGRQPRQAPAGVATRHGSEGSAAEADGDADESGAGRRYAQPTWMQLTLLLRRGLVSQWRNSPYNGMRFGIAFALAWILGSLYWGRGADR
jgi:hypothetical protein